MNPGRVTASWPDQRHPLDNELVLQARPLRAGGLLEDSSRFGDDRWSLGPAILQRQREALLINFEPFPDGYRVIAKELAYAMLSGQLPSGEQRLSVTTVRSIVMSTNAFFTWLDSGGSRQHRALADLTTNDLENYQRRLIVTAATSSIRRKRQNAVHYLWRYRSSLLTDRLTINPRSLPGWDTQGADAQSAGPENATERIPEQIHGPLLGWALRFVDDFAPDIVAADQQWRLLRSRRPANNPRGTAVQDLRALLDDHRRRGRPLPGWNSQVNQLVLAQTLACSRQTVIRYSDEIQAAAALVGISTNADFDIEITGRLAGQPWVDQIVTASLARNGLAVLARMLHAACYITVAFLSGMRDSEVKHLRRGCLRVERDTDGRPYRWKVTSHAFKGESDPAGVEATWVVGEPVARAISVLEQLQPEETDLLFTTLRHGPGSKTAATNDVLGIGSTIKQLNLFVAWVNDHCEHLQLPDRIPDVNGHPWKLTSRQFRRTLAWFIARRPGGAIAGAIAYRHHAIQLFEGYAGTSESGFRAEVESEQALARGEQLIAMIDQHEHKTFTGPARGEAEHRLTGFAEHAGFNGTVITDPQRLKRVLRRHDPAVYPGTYVTCVFDPAKALCLRKHAPLTTLPVLTDCQPLECRNVALTADNTTSWTSELTSIDKRLASSPELPPLLAQRLRDRRAAINAFLERQQRQDQP